MKINKDLVDAMMMLSIIGLVLVGTTDFENQSAKYLGMVALGFTAISSVVMRILVARRGS